MATVCSSFPTLTSTQEIRTQTVFTTFSPVVSTIPASTLSSTATVSCENSSCPSAAGVTEVPARTTTSRVPVTITSEVQTFSVSTYWGTSCDRSSNDLPSSTPTTPSTAIALPFTSSSPSLSSPLPSSSFQSNSLSQATSIVITTMPNGMVISQTLTITTLPPEQTTTIITTSVHDQNDAKLGRIVGGAIGGAAALGMLVLAVWYILKKRLAADSGLKIFFERVGPPTKGYRQFDDSASTNSHQPFADNRRGTQQAFINLQHRQSEFPSHEAFNQQINYHSFEDQLPASQSNSRKFPRVSHPHLLPQETNPFRSQRYHHDLNTIQPPWSNDNV